MADNDRDRWNQRYRREGRLAHGPDRYLTSWDSILPYAGRALEVAGGTGRNAIWLARRGLDVTVTDISKVGLELAERDARTFGVSLQTTVIDLEFEPLPVGPWDVIVDIHFLWRPIFVSVAKQLALGGYFVFVQPTMSNLQRHSRPGPKFLLHDRELPDLISNLNEPGLQIIDYQEGWLNQGRHEACLLARKMEP